MTFSLVACDPVRREWGVAVASRFLAAGAVVPFAAAETGAVAAQAAANVRFGPDGLRLPAERLYELHRLSFGSTSPDEWLDADETLAGELRERLGRLGHASGDLAVDFESWAGIEKLEERVSGVERIDPVFLGELRKAT